MRYSELEDHARFRARDESCDRWAGSPEASREMEAWAEERIADFLEESGLSAYRDVVSFKAGEPQRAMRDSDAVLALEYELGPAWADDARLAGMLGQLSGNAVTSSWVDAQSIKAALDEMAWHGLSSAALDALEAVSDEVPFGFLNLTWFEDLWLDRIQELLESGELDQEFTRDGELAD